MPADPAHQLELFRAAVAALGGQHAAARALPMSERNVRKLAAGEGNLHDGILEDLARALIRHADHCRELERQLSPAFLDNRTAAQIKGTANRGRRPRQRLTMSFPNGLSVDFAGDDDPIRGKEID